MASTSEATQAKVSDLEDPKLEALVELMWIAANADDEVSDVERAELRRHVEGLTAGRFAGDKVDALFAACAKLLETDGREKRIAAVRDRLEKPIHRELAIATAIRIFAVDGIVRTSERDMILELAEALGIDGNVAADLVKEVTAPKNV
jgi:tellurite resistance protein